MTDKPHGPLPGDRYAKYEGHTPGPWKSEPADPEMLLHPNLCHEISGEDWFGLAVVCTQLVGDSLPDAAGVANARLIADAPALLAENRRLRTLLEKAVSYIELVADDTDGVERAEARQDIEAIRAALQGDTP